MSQQKTYKWFNPFDQPHSRHYTPKQHRENYLDNLSKAEDIHARREIATMEDIDICHLIMCLEIDRLYGIGQMLLDEPKVDRCKEIISDLEDRCKEIISNLELEFISRRIKRDQAKVLAKYVNKD